jgi:hypothetical protein
MVNKKCGTGIGKLREGKTSCQEKYAYHTIIFSKEKSR